MKVPRVFFYVNVKRDEVFVDERRQTGVCVRLFLESLARTSGRGRAEIDQQRRVLLFRFRKGLIGILDPVDTHLVNLRYIENNREYEQLEYGSILCGWC